MDVRSLILACLFAFTSCVARHPHPATPLRSESPFTHAAALDLATHHGVFTRATLIKSPKELRVVYEGHVQRDAIEVRLKIYRTPQDLAATSSAFGPFALGPSPKLRERSQAFFSARLAEAQESSNPARVFTTSIVGTLGTNLGKLWVGESTSFLAISTDLAESALSEQHFGVFHSGHWTLEVHARIGLTLDEEPHTSSIRELLRAICQVE